MSDHTGVLYIVATPIGHLDDISARARQVLASVDLILAEDTRHSKKLLQALAVSTPMRAYHDFNEREAASAIVESLLAGQQIAVISDAGTPLISDPGYHLVSLCHQSGVQVVPIPGPSALICALSAAGLPTTRFIFEGFVPERRSARQTCFAALKSEARTLVFYEAPHRIMDFLVDAGTVFGGQRRMTIARELTKKFETIVTGTIAELSAILQQDEQQRRGEFVVLIEGEHSAANADDNEAKRVLAILLASVGVKQAAVMAAEITGRRKNELYQWALEMQGSGKREREDGK